MNPRTDPVSTPQPAPAARERSAAGTEVDPRVVRAGTGRECVDRPHRPLTLLTHHAHLLLAVARAPDARVRELAEAVGVTSRAALDLLQDLERAGCLHRTRRGRRNHYTVHPDCAITDAEAGWSTVRDFLVTMGLVDTGPARGPR